MRVDIIGLEALLERTKQRRERVEHLGPAFTVFGASIVKQTDDCFQMQRDWNGEPFAALAESTLAQKIGKVAFKGRKLQEDGTYKRRSRKAYAKKRARVRAKLTQPNFARSDPSRGNIKILIDTARARNSNHVDDPEATYMLWSAVGYLAYHMTGTSRMPERNPTPFVWASKAWGLHPRARTELNMLMLNYVLRGDPLAGAR